MEDIFENALLDKTFGCLAAGAIGDAMGAPVEEWHYKAIREKYGVIDKLLPHLGTHQLERGKGSFTYTDDTHLRNYVISTIIRKGGRITAYDLAEVWLKDFEPFHNNANDILIFTKLCRGVPPREAGEGAIVSITAALGIAPIGIINACDPRTAAMDAFELACMNQWKHGREAAMSIAAAVAEAFKPNATLESVINASKAYVGPELRNAIERAIKVASRYKDPIQAIPEFYNKLLFPPGSERSVVKVPYSSMERVVVPDYWGKTGLKPDNYSFSADPLEMVPVSLAFFYIAKGDPLKAIIGGINFGRDCDGIAGFAGSIAGAMCGSNKIPMNMVETINKANNIDLMEQARKLQRPIIHVMKEKERNINLLKSLF